MAFKFYILRLECRSRCMRSSTRGSLKDSPEKEHPIWWSPVAQAPLTAFSNAEGAVLDVDVSMNELCCKGESYVFHYMRSQTRPPHEQKR